MEKITTEIKDALKETIFTTFELLKIMIPISIVVKILGKLGIIAILGDFLAPIMGLVGLPGDFGLVWATAMITNIYGGLLVFFSLSVKNPLTVAQVTVLGTMILVAHTLLIESRITQKAGVRLWFMLSLRVLGAFILGWVLNIIFTSFNLYQSKSILLWKPIHENSSIFYWIIGECKNYFMIFVIILSLLVLMKILKISGAINRLNNFLEPILKYLGMSKDAAPVTIIGMTLGLAYGGGLIIKEVKSGYLSKKDAFLSLSLMGLSHSLIEDTLLMLAIGSSLVGILFARILFTITVMVILIKFITYLSKNRFERYFVIR